MVGGGGGGASPKVSSSRISLYPDSAVPVSSLYVVIKSPDRGQQILPMSM